MIDGDTSMALIIIKTFLRIRISRIMYMWAPFFGQIRHSWSHMCFYHLDHFSSKNDYFALKNSVQIYKMGLHLSHKKVSCEIYSPTCVSMYLKNELKITEENFTKFAGLKLIFYPISSFFCWKIWWNEVKDQFQTPNFGEIFFGHLTLIFQFWW